MSPLRHGRKKSVWRNFLLQKNIIEKTKCDISNSFGQTFVNVASTAAMPPPATSLVVADHINTL
jgi:hypothetical protein